GLENHRMC
nr:Chain Q, C-terminal fragment of upain-1-W3A [synthetic construct]